METLSVPQTPDATRGWQAVEDARRLLRALGADDDLLRRIVLRTDLGERQYVSIPPLPVALVERLVLGQPGEVPTC
jgi:hypothetical protein